MRRILIVGAGQAGLQLALGLQQHGYDVTVLSARTPAEVRSGRITSTQVMFHRSIEPERELGIHYWQQQAPNIEGVRFSVAPPDGQRALDWVGRLENPAQSVDQRAKMATWMEVFEQRGGNLVVHGATTADLDALAKRYDLAIVSAGRGELGQLFPRDAERSPHTSPQRVLAVSYVHGGRPCPDDPEDLESMIRFNPIPGVGELFVLPAWTFSGPCDIPFFECVPGGPLDCWSDRPGPKEHWSRMLELMREHVPWEHERFKDAELTDEQATLTGAVTPVVREPVGELPSGHPVLGMADAVVTNDPLTGQGSNNASRCASAYLASILARGDEPYDREWMRATFDAYWELARHTVQWTNFMLGPPPDYLLEAFGAAGEHPQIADEFVSIFDDPPRAQEICLDEDRVRAYVDGVVRAGS
jgi:2-polyprenyl-6-methoxyphenol hydroxylase-like FAD-dependent oxidoreductase